MADKSIATEIKQFIETTREKYTEVCTQDGATYIG